MVVVCLRLLAAAVVALPLGVGVVVALPLGVAGVALPMGGGNGGGAPPGGGGGGGGPPGGSGPPSAPLAPKSKFLNNALTLSCAAMRFQAGLLLIRVHACVSISPFNICISLSDLM